MAIKTQNVARYTLTLYVDRPLIYFNDAGDEETFPVDVMEDLEFSTEMKRQLEREVLQALKKLDGDCDCEVIETEIVTEDV
jgi:hypothetical protein